MAKSTGDTRQMILETAYRLFYRKGFVRVGLDLIAAQAKVTKRTLYYHFRSKDDLLAAALAAHRELAIDRIRSWGDELPHKLDAFIEGLFTGLSRWAARPRWEGAGFTRLVMELADLPGHPAHAIARRHKADVEDWLAAQLAARGVGHPRVKAMQIASLVEGGIALALVHRDNRYITLSAEAARVVLQTVTARQPEPSLLASASGVPAYTGGAE